MRTGDRMRWTDPLSSPSSVSVGPAQRCSPLRWFFASFPSGSEIYDTVSGGARCVWELCSAATDGRLFADVDGGWFVGTALLSGFPRNVPVRL